MKTDATLGCYEGGQKKNSAEEQNLRRKTVQQSHGWGFFM